VTRVLVVDDSAPFRDAARAVLGRVPGFEVVGDADSGEGALAQAAALLPDLVLMDIRMPGISGIEASQAIRAAAPRTVVFLCSTYQRADLPAEVATSGAAAYVHKEQLSADLLAGLWAEHAPA
jgi:two-component system invasion response regulator UvrY